MQLLIDQSRLARALQVLGRLQPRKTQASSAPMALAAAGGELRLRATDLQSFAEVRLDADVHVPGEAAVDAKTLGSVAHAIAEGAVAMSSSGSGESLRLTQGSSSFRLRTFDPFLVPWEAASDPTNVEMEKDRLVDIVSRVTFCATDSDEASPFAGVMLSAQGRRFVMAATDGFQLAHYSADALDFAVGDGPLQGVLPTACVTACAKGLHAFGNEVVRIGWRDRSVSFSSGDIFWEIRRLETTYPDLSRLTGPMAGVRVEVDRLKLIEAVRQVATLAAEGYRICLSLRGDRLHLFTSQSELGEAQTAIQLQETMPPRFVWLDARGFANALKALPGSRAALYISEPLAPVAMVPVEPDADFRAVVSPVRHNAPESEAI